MPLETTTICQRLMFPASPGTVFEMITDPVKMAEFSGMEVTERPDGTIVAGNGRFRFRNLELERGGRIVQAWSSTEWPEGLPPSRLEFRLKAIGQGTDLAMLQEGVPTEDAERCSEAWHIYYWNPLFDHLRIMSTGKK